MCVCTDVYINIYTYIHMPTCSLCVRVYRRLLEFHRNTIRILYMHTHRYVSSVRARMTQSRKKRKPHSRQKNPHSKKQNTKPCRKHKYTHTHTHTHLHIHTDMLQAFAQGRTRLPPKKRRLRRQRIRSFRKSPKKYFGVKQTRKRCLSCRLSLRTKKRRKSVCWQTRQRLKSDSEIEWR